MLSITTIYINSKDLISGSTNNFTYQLPQGIRECKAYFVKNVSIPFSQYVTIYKPTSGSNVLVSFSDASGPHNFSLIPGNYNSVQLAALLQSALNTATGAGTPYTVTYSTSTNLYTISSSVGTFDIYWTSANSLPGQNPSYSFGFLPITVQGQNIVSSQAANLNGTSLNYYVKSQSLTLDGSYSYFQSSKDSVISQIPIDVSPNSYILYKNNNEDFIPLRNSNLTQIDIQLVDDYNNFVDLNGLNWTLTLVIKN